jgi:hypothetical protein
MKLKLISMASRSRTEGRMYHSRLYVNMIGHSECRTTESFKDQLMHKVLQMLGLPNDTPVRYSAYAGCECGCSPGFIIQDWAGFRAKDIFVNVKLIA